MTKGDYIHLKRDGKIIKDTKIEGIHQAKTLSKKSNQAVMWYDI